MRLCNDTISVVNAYTGADGMDAYRVTVITGVSWYEQTVATVDDGLKAANKYVVRIPADANTHRSVYVPPEAFLGAEGTFTLRTGDLVAKGDLSALTGVNPAYLHTQYPCLTILGVTDDRRARAPHWKVVGA